MKAINKYIFYFSLFTFHFSLIFAQSTYEPVYNQEIYTYLSNLNSKGVITFFDDIRPITRLTIAKKLILIKKEQEKLTDIERQQLNFYNKEYAFELKYLKKDTTKINEFFKFGVTDRFDLFKFYSKSFTMKINPVFKLSYDSKQKNYHQFGGVELKGRISDFLGYYFSYRDNLEKGDNLDRRKLFTPETGVIRSKGSLNSFEYSETRGGFTFGGKWGNITAAKDFINIGSSYQSSVILSSKAPSFPYLRISINPVKWFHYDFIHAWLNSNLVDSNTIRYTGVSSTFENRTTTFSRRMKYYVSHSFSFRPVNNWWFTVGESIIYGDKLEYIYFLPVFFRLADHYNSKGGADSGDNAQLFFNTSYRWIKIKSKLYFSLYIDELSPESFFSGGNNAQVLAWTLGGRFTNPLWKDSYVTLEYTGVKPYSYMNADPNGTYFSSGYQLGHWIGSNAVQYYFLFEQYLSRSLKLKLQYQQIRKGSKESIDNYYNRVTSTYPLLSGVVSDYSELLLNLQYNPYHDLYFNIQYSNILKANGRFINEYKKRKGVSLITSISYGF